MNLDLVAAVIEPSSGIGGGDLGERLFHRLKQGFVAAPTELSEDVLYLGERLLYGVQVRRVGGHEHQLRSPRLDELPYPLGPVCPEVVHHHDLPLTKRRGQKVLDV